MGASDDGDDDDKECGSNKKEKKCGKDSQCEWKNDKCVEASDDGGDDDKADGDKDDSDKDGDKDDGDKGDGDKDDGDKDDDEAKCASADSKYWNDEKCMRKCG